MNTTRLLLHLEGLAQAAASIVLFAALHGSGLLFAALILVPDLSMIGYARSPRVGSWIYNAVHTNVVPMLLGAIAFAAGETNVLLIALIWLAHIGMDRMMGYGLKYPDAFKSTHLQKV